jgi:hypothetical protein
MLIIMVSIKAKVTQITQVLILEMITVIIMVSTMEITIPNIMDII